jgi:hypothetical protein
MGSDGLGYNSVARSVELSHQISWEFVHHMSKRQVFKGHCAT